MLSVNSLEEEIMWKVIQCAVQGKSHIKDSIPCQDKTFCYTDDNITVTALADGAGSASLSHFGADQITRFICNDFVECFDLYFNDENGITVKQIIDSKIKQQISEMSVDLDCKTSDLSSTLLVAAVKNNKFILLHIGDGVIGYSKNSQIRVATKPENGEFANTTVFTTSSESIATMKLIKGYLNSIDGFILMSDGTEASLYNKKENCLSEALGRLLKMLNYIPAEKMESQLTESFNSVIKDATIDDCSIVMMAFCQEFEGYLSLYEKDKYKLMEINQQLHVSKKTFNRLDTILNALIQPCSLKKIARLIHLRPKYAKKYLSRLMFLNYIEKKGCLYHTILIM